MEQWPADWAKGTLKLKEIWAIRIRRQLADKARDLALFNLAIDSKLRGCDLVSLRVCDIAQGEKRLSAGFDHHFVKPIDTTELAEILNAIRGGPT